MFVNKLNLIYLQRHIVQLPEHHIIKKKEIEIIIEHTLQCKIWKLENRSIALEFRSWRSQTFYKLLYMRDNWGLIIQE